LLVSALWTRSEGTVAVIREVVERYARVGGQFAARVHRVGDDAWDSPAPCEGWAARDVVAHLVEWVWAFPLAKAGVEQPASPPATDPREAWDTLDSTIRAALADPGISTRRFDTPLGRVTFEQAIDIFVIPDLVIHTWDLARAAGLDDTLDPREVHRVLDEMTPVDQMLRDSGQYGPRFSVPNDADEQTRLIAFTGRDPSAKPRWT
jgi:uncharacterized protein (TIGR03086 family)